MRLLRTPLWALPIALITNGTGGCLRVCTEKACRDGHYVDLTPRDAWGAGSYEFNVSLDGVTTTCTANLPLPPCGTADPVTCSPDTNQVVIVDTGCFQAPDLQGFAGLEILPPNPKTMTLRISRDGSPLLEKSWTPSYRESRPNGEDCPPTCLLARTTLTVPL